jgi:hypothetical protein
MIRSPVFAARRAAPVSISEWFSIHRTTGTGAHSRLLGAGNRNWRIIYTDGRPAVQASEAVASYYGTSVGKWEGDTLIVDSVGFNEKFWMTSGGLPHTEALHLIERFSRPDMDTLKYEVTVDDPRAYTRRWTASWTVQWIAGEDLQEYFCEENADPAFDR